jgi:hypothetical protein
MIQHCLPLLTLFNAEMLLCSFMFAVAFKARSCKSGINNCLKLHILGRSGKIEMECNNDKDKVVQRMKQMTRVVVLKNTLK